MTWDQNENCCCFCGNEIPKDALYIFVEERKLCLKCINMANRKLAFRILHVHAENFPLLSACLTYPALNALVETDNLGLGNPAFITQKLFGKKFPDLISFLEYVFKVIDQQVEAAANLPAGFENGLVHILDENGLALCGFSQNVRELWPPNQGSTTSKKYLEGLSCPRCGALALLLFPDHPAATT